MPMLYTIPGRPIPWARAGYNRETACIYDRQKMERIQQKLLLEHQHGANPFYEGPLFLFMTFYMPINKSFSIRKKAEMEGTHHFCKSDIDNLQKWVMDLSSNVLFKDDCQICDLSVRKRYSNNPRTVFSLLELDNHGNENHRDENFTEEETKIITSFTNQS